MLIVITLGILVVLTMFSIILGNDFIDGSVTLGVDATALVNGEAITYETLDEVVNITIDTTGIFGAIVIITAVLIGIALIVGISFISSGINPEAGKIVIIASAYIAIWTLFSIIAAPLVQSIELFGFILYVMITLGYTVGVVKSVVGND